MKKRLYRELFRVFGFKVQGANQYTLELDEYTACVLFDFWRQAFYIFLRKQTETRSYTGVFVTMKKRFYRDLNPGLWIQSPRC